ncbi:FadR/GntR family transcriptional regulator [Planktotalea arctica]|uniref:FadR/GntR family transcriptional regulator n=1 Tax=Planktotalea arctica TaxID=1481893 RepID=UPI000A16EED1|nr:FadR/GntR family transcriptional regulator [Planktotalea arctica]
MNTDATPLFDPIGHESVSATIVKRVEEMIVTGVLKDGTRLPSERSLAEAMQVSRPKVREALQQLEASDLIQVRHGEGSFVAPLIGTAMSPALVELYARHTTAFSNYLEFRHEQECFAASLAAERATEDDLSILRAIMEDIEQAHASGDAETSRSADVRFHSAIVDASHNSLLIHTMASIYELMQKNVFYNRKFLRAMDGSGEKLLQQHRDIAEAIFAHDPSRAAEAASAHIEFVAASFKVSVGQTKRELVSRRRRAMLEISS